VRLYATPEEALKKLASEFEYWSGRLTDVSLQMCYALIGANWVVFGSSIKGIVGNLWATFSLTLVLLALATNVIAAFIFSESLRKRIDYGTSDAERFVREFNGDRGMNAAWPFTDLIQNLGLYVRWTRAILTLASGALLIAGAIAGL
jgi:hypothetical protein